MAAQHSTHERRVDRDGVARIEEPRRGEPRSGGLWIVGLGAGFLVLALVLSVWLSGAPREPEPEPKRVSARPRSVTASSSPARPVTQSAMATVAQSPGEEAMEEEPVPDEEESSQPTWEMHPGETGLALYKPGTKPIKRGIVVPEGFELPPGYLRHYQTTDDGQMLQAILMFHPDYKPLDAKGQPVPLPESRVVPPEMAPPGMPIQMLELPKDDGSGNTP